MPKPLTLIDRKYSVCPSGRWRGIGALAGGPMSSKPRPAPSGGVSAVAHKPTVNDRATLILSDAAEAASAQPLPTWPPSPG